MGAPMAENLRKHLAKHPDQHPPLLVFNRTHHKMPAPSDSVQQAKSARELAEQCDVVVTSLANDEAALAVYAELYEGAKIRGSQGKGTIFIDTSTSYPTTCGQLEREATKIPGAVYLCAPVFGPPPMAKEAKLVIVLSGDLFAKKKVSPYLVPALGRRVLDVGSDVERAASLKLIGNGTLVCVFNSPRAPSLPVRRGSKLTCSPLFLARSPSSLLNAHDVEMRTPSLNLFSAAA